MKPLGSTACDYHIGLSNELCKRCQQTFAQHYGPPPPKKPKKRRGT